MTREQRRAVCWGLIAAGLLGFAIFIGSRNLRHIDAALVGYLSLPENMRVFQGNACVRMVGNDAGHVV